MSISRRNLMGLGTAGLLASFFGSGASAEETAKSGAPKRCILLWMNGGASHLDTFDTKAKGHFKSIATRAPGIQISEKLPMLAEQMHHVALLRGMTSKEGSHERAQSLGHTGHIPNPTVRAPSLGAWVAKSQTGASTLPRFVSLGGPSHDAGFLGSALDPFVVGAPGSSPDDVSPDRAFSNERETLRYKAVDALNRSFDQRVQSPRAVQRSLLTDQARAMKHAPGMRAFDCSSEPASVQAAYGDTAFGRGCLTARRLVEVGVPFIEVALDGWDTHQNNFDRTTSLMQTLDAGAASLLRELEERGLLDTTLVAWMTEFGRTPAVNGNEGRDHHPQAYSVWLAGCGIRGGVVRGETDGSGGRVTKGASSPADVISTMAQAVGLDPELYHTTPNGRPIMLTEGGRPIRELLGA